VASNANNGSSETDTVAHNNQNQFSERDKKCVNDRRGMRPKTAQQFTTNRSSTTLILSSLLIPGGRIRAISGETTMKGAW